MRKLFGSLIIMVLITIFSGLLFVTAEEVQQAESFHSFLDREVKLESAALSENSMIYDRNGKIISEIFNDENRIYLPFEDIPQVVIDALLAAEDQSFYDHQGFDVQGITRALLINLNNQSIQQGGSTVTQQLVRNLYLTKEQTYERKLTELLYAYQLERRLSKEEIIELYVNAIYFQNGAYGIEAAAQLYFDKQASDLTLSEAAFLCSIPNRPQLYDPFVNIEQTNERKQWILTKMLEVHVIDDKQYEEALHEEVELSPRSRIDLYPDYVTYVHEEFKQLVAKEDGYQSKINNASSEKEKGKIRDELNEHINDLFKKGLRIETTLDPDMQRETVNEVNSFLGTGDLQGAVTTINHQENEIVAITGGKNYRKFDFHRSFQAFRQPGSAIKPLLVFAPYMEYTNANGQSPIDASPFSKGSYSPRNFGGAVYGRVSLQDAFKHSYNTAAVRMLYTIGVESGFSHLEPFAFSKVTNDDYVLPAALGGFKYGLSVLEMTKAYTTFSTNGLYHSPKAIRQVTDKEGKVLYEWNNDEKQVWSTHTAQRIKDMMNLVVTEGTGRHANFSTGNYIGGKTGTTNDFHDLWFIGATDTYTTGLWLGTDANSSIRYASERNYHTRLWRQVMENIER
ncbi:penicillin-binding protein [Bacillus shivajii]|uniref:transglycosylase domain-containing protein n=1 Tax=Bacillus shivajii TaxID=1983719 RepID=UPI001CFA44FF|nr:transglycosylase domain-containing protein [Bacillus shivajii]UCZ54155.1 penicillin-binding protein [Bacillus shivajii]